MKDKQGWIENDFGFTKGLGDCIRKVDPNWTDALREDQSTGDIVKSGATEWI